MKATAGQSTSTRGRYLVAILRILAECVFACHGVFAVGWWWLMPGGFPIGHVRFWANAVWPSALLAVSVAGLAAIARRRADWCKACVLALGVMALSAAATAMLIFPDIKRIVVLAASIVGLIELGLATFIAAPWPSKRALAGLAVVTALLGSFMPVAQRAGRPTTHPLDQVCPWAEMASAGTALDGFPQPVGELDRTTVYPASHTVIVKLGAIKLQMEPLLTFESTSPSGCWSILSQQGAEGSTTLGRLTKMAAGNGQAGASPLLFGGAHDWLSVVEQGAIDVTAYSEISAPIFAHLDTCCILTISGHQDLRLEFSPCGSARFEPLPSDYPVGRPARFAYCSAQRDFRVVEAASGEKGPFVTLGEGRLEPDACLSIGLVDSGKRVADVRLDDWAAQLSTALSPTAGWGVAVNAIEFQRMGDNRRDAVTIWITLAATAVGRGWDTVGHAAGTYRNRITIEPAEHESQ